MTKTHAVAYAQARARQLRRPVFIVGGASGTDWEITLDPPPAHGLAVYEVDESGIVDDQDG